MKMNSGVYRITHEGSGAYYIGSSVAISERMRSHRGKLAVGQHRNCRLQRVHDKYGADSLTYETLLVCDPENTLRYEQAILDSCFDDERCMNLARDAKAPMKGRKFSDEHRENQSKSLSRLRYVLHYADGSKIEGRMAEITEATGLNSRDLTRAFTRFGNLGRKMVNLGIVRGERNDGLVIVKREKRPEPWQLAGATSRTQYYRELRRKRGRS